MKSESRKPHSLQEMAIGAAFVAIVGFGAYIYLASNTTHSEVGGLENATNVGFAKVACDRAVEGELGRTDLNIDWLPDGSLERSATEFLIRARFTVPYGDGRTVPYFYICEATFRDTGPAIESENWKVDTLEIIPQNK